MAVEIHVDGRVAQGRLTCFAAGLERYLAYARDHGYTVPKVLQGLSGPMNSIRLTYRYEDLNAYESHEARTLRDAGYAAEDVPLVVEFGGDLQGDHTLRL